MVERASTIPRLDLDNLTDEVVEAFYPEVAQFDTDPELMRNTGRLLAHTHKPDRVSFTGDARELLTDQVLDNKRILWVPNHVHKDDQFNVVGADDEFDEIVRDLIIERLRILFKFDYLKDGESEDGESTEDVLGIPAANLIELGGIPVIRQGDDPVAGTATSPMIDSVATLILRGYDPFGFAEGTRNKKRPEKVQKLKNGMANISFRAMELMELEGLEVEEPILEPVGIVRKGGQIRVHFGEPITDYRENGPLALTRRLRLGIQAAVNASRLD